MIGQDRLVSWLIKTAVPLHRPVAAATARGVSRCASAPPPRQIIGAGLGVLESAIVDPDGRLFVASQTWNGHRGALLRLDDPHARAQPIAEGIFRPGGLALDEHGRLIVGYGDDVLVGLWGNVVGRAGLLLINPDTGQRRTYATGLSMANGIARAPDGTVFASNDVGTHIERIDRSGGVHRRWARVWSANGLAIDPTGKYLYAAQTFARAAIVRVDLTDPTTVITYARPSRWGQFAALDGMDIDEHGRLYVAANGAGQIWRIDTNGTICVLAGELPFVSAVALGRGSRGFSAGNLYAVTFSGTIVGIPVP